MGGNCHARFPLGTSPETVCHACGPSGRGAFDRRETSLGGMGASRPRSVEDFLKTQLLQKLLIEPQNYRNKRGDQGGWSHQAGRIRTMDRHIKECLVCCKAVRFESVEPLSLYERQLVHLL